MSPSPAVFTRCQTRWLVIVGVVITSVALLPVSARAQTAEVRYERALARETAARNARSTTVAQLRAIADTYEGIVRRYPRSGYSDNALWQAAGVLQLAFERTGSTRDRTRAEDYLTWLRREYPSSSLIKEIPARLAQLRPRRAQPATAQRAPTPAAFPRAAGARESATEDAAAAATPADARDGSPALPSASPPAVTEPPVGAENEKENQREASRADTLTSGPAAAAAAPVAAPDAAAMSAGESTAGPASAAPGGATVRSIAYSRLPRGDRVTIEISQEVPFAFERGSEPDRLVLALPGVSASEGVRTAAGAIEGAFVESLELNAAEETGLELALDLAGQPRYSTFPLYGPYRLVIDIENPTLLPDSEPVVARTDEPAPSAPAAVPPKPEAPSSTSRGDYSLARQLGLGVSRIVIDPGHGGHDPGAQANSLSEAELVLDVSLRLEKLLGAQPGFEVVLTRRTDTFVPLEERTAMANREDADLFLSIHANSSPNRETRGIETFFLNFATNAGDEAVAARENAASGQAMHLLPDLVKAIATTDKVAESRELATMVQQSLMRRVGALSKTIKDLGVKQAPFVVLIGAQMPSVLAEISFLTNRTEASLLRQAAHRQRIAQALSDAILRYQASLKTAPAVATRSEER